MTLARRSVAAVLRVVVTILLLSGQLIWCVLNSWVAVEGRASLRGGIGQVITALAAPAEQVPTELRTV